MAGWICPDCGTDCRVPARGPGLVIVKDEKRIVGGVDGPAEERTMPDNDEVEILHANADKTQIVPRNHPDARYVVNPDSPGEFEDLVKAHKKGDHKAQNPAEDKGFEPLPPGNPEREKHDRARGK